MRYPRDQEENDLPFVSNELRDSPSTMDKPLDTADAPGKADSELVDETVEAEPAAPAQTARNTTTAF
jgi:hypothetical protein